MEDSDLIDDYDYHPEPTDDELSLATFAHLGSLAGCIFPIASIVLPLVIWLVKREESEYVDIQAKEALNFQISMMIMFIVAALLCFILIGIPILIGLVVFDIVVSIIAAIKAKEGKYYEYPLNFRFIQ